MNNKYMLIVTTMTVMLIGAAAFATDSVFADGKKKYEKSFLFLYNILSVCSVV